MKISLAVRLILAAMLLATGASAAPAPANSVVEAPSWSAGSEWHYSDGYAVKVASVSPKGALFQRLDAPGQSFTRDGFIRTDSTSATATRKAIYRTVPDSAGQSLSAAKPLTFQREYLNNGTLMVHASSWTVEGRETITVPAGTFDCWVIVWRTRSLRSDWTGFERWWYSPDVQNYVRMEFKYGPEPDGSRVLMNYRLAASSTPVAASPLPATPASAVPEPVAAPVPSNPVPPKIIMAPPISPPKSVTVTAPFLPVHSLKVTELVAPMVSPAQMDDKIAEIAPAPGRLGKGGEVGAWHAQLRQSQDPARARANLEKILADNPDTNAMPGGVAVHNIEGLTFYRAWLGSYDSGREALSLCKALKIVPPAHCAIFKGATIQARND
jgi:hypothetical protein